MKRIFLGGSRRVSRLNDIIRKRLSDIVGREMQVVVGDANGADRALQRQLADWKYPHVVVYFVGSRPRNNEGGWPVFHVQTAQHARGYEFYAAKDRQMVKQAECGMMLWDGKSRGTLENVENLIRDGKPVLLYLSPVKRFVNASSPKDLESLYAICGKVERLNETTTELEHQASFELPGIVSRKPARRVS